MRDVCMYVRISRSDRFQSTMGLNQTNPGTFRCFHLRYLSYGIPCAEGFGSDPSFKHLRALHALCQDIGGALPGTPRSPATLRASDVSAKNCDLIDNSLAAKGVKR